MVRLGSKGLLHGFESRRGMVALKVAREVAGVLILLVGAVGVVIGFVLSVKSLQMWCAAMMVFFSHGDFG